jgi:osmotically-inducible protein OsmY
MKTAEDFSKGVHCAITQSDHDLASEIRNAFNRNWGVTNVTVKADVKNGWVTLEGNLTWSFQKDAIDKSVNGFAGVKGVTNNIRVKSEANDKIEKKDIELAFAGHWSSKDNDINIDISGNVVTLHGHAKSFYQKEWAGRIAESSPGVALVDNELDVDTRL